MVTYIDEEFYINNQEDKAIPDSDLKRLIIEASSYIKKQTLNRISLNNIPYEVKYATCLIVNKLYEFEEKKKEIGNLKSQNIEGWSETYQDINSLKIEVEKDKTEILEMYLSDLVGNDGNFLLSWRI